MTNGALTGAVTSTGGAINGIDGPATLTTGAGTTTLTGSNTYAGATNVNGGALLGGSVNAFGATSATSVAANGTLDLGGFNQMVSMLSGAGTVRNTGEAAAVLTNQGASSTFSGVIEDDGQTGLTQNSTTGGVLTLTGINTYTGLTTVQAGGLVNRGTITGAVVNDAGATLTNATAAEIKGGVTNAGMFIGSGVVDVGVVNQATGVIALNGGGTNTLIVNGTYQGAAGSVVTVDGNFTTRATDELIVHGLASGQLNMAVTTLDSPLTRPFWSTPIALASADAGSTAAYSVTGYPKEAGLVIYKPKMWTDSGTQYYGLVNSINGQAAGGLVSGVVSIQNAIATSFFKPANTFVVSPLNPSPNEVSVAPWIRVQGAAAHLSTSGSAALTTGEIVSTPSNANVDFGGFQAGLDAAVLNIEGSGVNIHAGLMAGVINGNSTQTAFPEKTTFNDDFIGAYAALFKGPLFVDAQVHEERIGYNVNVNTPVLSIPGSSVTGRRFSASTSASYTISVDDWGIIPAAGFTYANAQTGNLSFAQNAGTGQQATLITFGNAASAIGFAGLTVQKTFASYGDQLKLSPFVSLTGYHDFAGTLNSSLQLSPGTALAVAFPVTTQRLSTFGAASVGVNGLYLPKLSGPGRLVTGSLSADFQFGQQINSYGGTAQLRMDF